MFESENERQKIEPFPIPLTRASRNFPDVTTDRKQIKIYNWTSKIIPFIRIGTGSILYLSFSLSNNMLYFESKLHTTGVYLRLEFEIGQPDQNIYNFEKL